MCAPREVWSLQDARDVLTRMIGRIAEWTPMEVFLSPYLVRPEMRATVTASSFGASLELVREGKIDLRQTEPFAPLYHPRPRQRRGTCTPETGNG